MNKGSSYTLLILFCVCVYYIQIDQIAFVGKLSHKSLFPNTYITFFHVDVEIYTEKKNVRDFIDIYSTETALANEDRHRKSKAKFAVK